MTEYSNYIDPFFLERITYIDTEGKRRVKNPYRNRKSYSVLIPLVDGSGNFVFQVPEGVAGKSVLVEFPAKVIYQYIVSASNNTVTIIGVPAMTYVEITVVNPVPFPPSNRDLYWDDLDYDAQKSIVAAWGDIESICNANYPSTVESELGFDDQNTIKYGLVGWKNNCGNNKGTDWARPKPPKNDLYFPPQPEPTEPQEPGGPEEPGEGINHDYDYLFTLRWQDSTSTDIDFHGYVDHRYLQSVHFGSKEYGTGTNRMWLDFDYISHGPNGYEEEPEVITVLGLKSSVISIQVRNFNAGVLSQDVVVEAFTAEGQFLKKYTIPYYHFNGQRSAFWVFDFYPGTGVFEDKMKPVPIGTFN